jgi:hypothetical protein
MGQKGTDPESAILLYCKKIKKKEGNFLTKKEVRNQFMHHGTVIYKGHLALPLLASPWEIKGW